MKIFSGRNSKEMTQTICDNMDQIEGEIKIDKFLDGEILPIFKESVRNEDVYFINTLNTPESIMETLLVIDAAKRSGSKSFTLVAPYMGYSRQDKVDHLRSSIGSKVIADILEKVGMTSIITIDLHSSGIQGFFNVPVIHLNGNKIFIDYIKELKNKNDLNLCILAPDQGAVKRASDFCKSFPESSFAMINKRRIKPNEVHSMELVGDVRGRDVIIVDDMADTLGTLKKSSDLVMENGAKSVRAICTHGILSGNAIPNLESSHIIELIVSDTISQKPHPKISVISSSNIISRAMVALSNRISINEINQVS